MIKYINKILILILVLLLTSCTSDIKSQTNTPNLNIKLQQCPDQWIDNQMPSTDKIKSETQYFIFNGERRELNEFDIEWVQKNCNPKKQVVF